MWYCATYCLSLCLKRKFSAHPWIQSQAFTLHMLVCTDMKDPVAQGLVWVLMCESTYDRGIGDSVDLATFTFLCMHCLLFPILT